MKIEKNVGKPTILVNPRLGRAIVYEPDGRIFLLDSDKLNIPEYAEHADHAYLERFLFGPFARNQSDLVIPKDSGVYPYEDLYKYLELCSEKNEAMTLFLQSLDPTIEISLRKSCAELAEQYFTDTDTGDAVKKHVQDLLLKVPMPAKLDVENGPKEGIAGELLREAVEKWRPKENQ